MSSFWEDVINRVRNPVYSTSAPFGVTRVDETLVYGEDTLQLVDASDEDIITFYTDVVGIKVEYVRITCWKDIKKKCVRDGLLREYVFRHTHIDDDELQQLLSNFHLNIGIKKIQHDNIKIGEDGLIEMITGPDGESIAYQASQDAYE